MRIVWHKILRRLKTTFNRTHLKKFLLRSPKPIGEDFFRSLKPNEPNLIGDTATLVSILPRERRRRSVVVFVRDLISDFSLPGKIVCRGEWNRRNQISSFKSKWLYLSHWKYPKGRVTKKKRRAANQPKENMEWRSEAEKERTSKEELVHKRGLRCSTLCSSHSKWRAGEKNERGWSPKPPGQENSLQNRKERWRYFRNDSVVSQHIYAFCILLLCGLCKAGPVLHNKVINPSHASYFSSREIVKKNL